MTRIPIKKPTDYDTFKIDWPQIVARIFRNQKKELKTELEKLKALQKDTLDALLRAQETNRRLNRRNQELESAIAKEMKELRSIKLDLRHEESRIRYWADRLRSFTRDFESFQVNEYREIYNKRYQEFADYIYKLLGGGKE